MTKKLLESYLANKRIIERNRAKIEEERFKELPAYIGNVKGSAPEFPYTEQRFSVYMNDPVEEEKSVQKIKKLEEELGEALSDMEKVEAFISGIEDVRTREIFQYRYLDGLKVTEVAEKIGYTHSCVSKKIQKHLETFT